MYVSGFANLSEESQSSQYFTYTSSAPVKYLYTPKSMDILLKIGAEKCGVWFCLGNNFSGG